MRLQSTDPQLGFDGRHGARASTDDPNLSLAVDDVEQQSPAPRVRSKRIISEMSGVSPRVKASLTRETPLESTRGAPRVHRAPARGIDIDVIRLKRSILKDNEHRSHVVATDATRLLEIWREAVI